MTPPTSATYITHMGDDLMVVNAARTSLAKRSVWASRTPRISETPGDPPFHYELRAPDRALIHYLVRGMTSHDYQNMVLELVTQWTDRPRVMKLMEQYRRTPSHFAPFTHPHITLHCSAPLAIARQCFKSRVGLTRTDEDDEGDMGESEVSRRYVDTAPQFPNIEWRARAEGVKQGSGDVLAPDLQIIMGNVLQTAAEVYSRLAVVIAPEQARFLLPTATMTEWYWTGSLLAWSRFVNLRSRPDAQGEIQTLAGQIDALIAPLFPVSWGALLGRTTE